MKLSEEYKPRLALRRESNIRSIGSSLSIEGVNFSIQEITEIINGKRVIGDAEDIYAVQNAYEAYSKMKDINPGSIEDLVSIQQDMMSGLLPLEHYGLREVKVGIYDGIRREFIYEAPEPESVKPMMDSLFDWYNTTDYPPLITSAVMHFSIEHIHPFIDGNGRTGRYWHTLILTKWDDLFYRIPIEWNIRKHQIEYYETIAECNKGDCTKFIEFSLRMIIEALDDAIKLGTNDNVARMVSMMDRGKTYSSKELMGMMGLKDLGKFRKNYIDVALKNKAICMTIQDNPKHRNQRYRLV